MSEQTNLGGGKQDFPSPALAIKERDFQVYDSLKKVTVDIIERHSGGARLVARGVTQEDAEYIVAAVRLGPKLLAALERAVKISGRVVNNWSTGEVDICMVCGELPESKQHDDDCWVHTAAAAIAEARGEHVGEANKKVGAS